MQMRSKRAANRSASQEDVDDDSSSGEEQYVIQPQLRRATRKTHASSSRAAAEAADTAEGQAVREAREARASGIIQQVQHPLKLDHEYTFRRVDRHHPHHPTDYTRGENQSMINRSENPYEWTLELHDHRF
jgi:hypothetical protein